MLSGAKTTSILLSLVFNLSFFKRKKDNCSVCNALEGLIHSKGKLRIIFLLTMDDHMVYNVSDKELFHDEDRKRIRS